MHMKPSECNPIATATHNAPELAVCHQTIPVAPMLSFATELSFAIRLTLMLARYSFTLAWTNFRGSPNVVAVTVLLRG